MSELKQQNLRKQPDFPFWTQITPFLFTWSPWKWTCHSDCQHTCPLWTCIYYPCLFIIDFCVSQFFFNDSCHASLCQIFTTQQNMAKIEDQSMVYLEMYYKIPKPSQLLKELKCKKFLIHHNHIFFVYFNCGL